MAAHDEPRASEYRCPECEGLLHDTRGELVFTYERYTITVTAVPMRQCERCDERLVAGPVGLAVSELVTNIHQSLQHGEPGEDLPPVPTDAIVVHYAARGTPAAFAIV